MFRSDSSIGPGKPVHNRTIVICTRVVKVTKYVISRWTLRTPHVWRAMHCVNVLVTEKDKQYMAYCMAKCRLGTEKNEEYLD